MGQITNNEFLSSVLNAEVWQKSFRRKPEHGDD